MPAFVLFWVVAAVCLVWFWRQLPWRERLKWSGLSLFVYVMLYLAGLCGQLN